MIRIATGDFEEQKKSIGRDNALAGELGSLAHELIHYRQWIETDSMSERGVIVKARHIIWAYAKTVDHP